MHAEICAHSVWQVFPELTVFPASDLLIICSVALSGTKSIRLSPIHVTNVLIRFSHSLETEIDRLLTGAITLKPCYPAYIG